MPEIAPVVANGAGSPADAGGAASPAEQAARTLNISQPNFRSITAVLSKGADEAFPRDAVGRAKFVRGWLVKDALADLMSKNKSGSVVICGIV